MSCQVSSKVGATSVGGDPSNTILHSRVCNKGYQLPSRRSLLMKLKVIACAIKHAGDAKVIDPMHIIVSVKLSVE
jgi:hypothetical protein